MSAGNTTERLKRRVLREAVAENIDVIRGVPPRALRRHSRWTRLWLRRAPLILLPLLLAGSSYMIANGREVATAPPASIVQLASASVRPPSVAPLPDRGATAPERVAASAFPLSVRRVVLDAGHGGTDPGATAGGLLEKEITLDIGRRLQSLLTRSGFDVVVTRDADHTIALKDRAELANEAKSDIFVSIHVNAIVKHTEVRGIETYYLGSTNDPTLTKLAAAENRISGYSVADMRSLVEDVYANARSAESHQLATTIQKNLYSALRTDDAALENWGVKRAPFLVLVGTEMPAVLAEVGCISNEKELAMLRRPEYRQKIAEALHVGIRSYASAGDAPQKKGIEKNG